MKKGKNQIAAFLLSSVMLAGILAGCSKNAENSSAVLQQDSTVVSEKGSEGGDYSQDVITYGMTQAWDTRLTHMVHLQVPCTRILCVINFMTVWHL